MKFFSCDENIKSYKTPILKIVFAFLLIIILTYRNYIIQINSSVINTIITVISGVMAMLAVLNIYLSFADMILLYERREAARFNLKSAIKRSKEYSIAHILSLLETNDIIEFSNSTTSGSYAGMYALFNNMHHLLAKILRISYNILL